MLNPNNERELAYIVKINKVEHHPNADRLDICTVNNWRCITGRDDFKEGDYAVYFEIDSKLPDVMPFSEMEFLKSKHFKIKAQKIRGEISMGLLLPISAFNWVIKDNKIIDPVSNKEYQYGDFLTEDLGVTYAVKEDNIRKAGKRDILNNIKANHPRFFSNKLVKYLMNFNWFRNIILFIFKPSKHNKKAFPEHFEYIHKSDEERCENLVWENYAKTGPWIKTTKIDGTSCTYIIEKKLIGKPEFYVCSRNVRMLNNKDDCYFEHNVYWEIANKYKIKDVLLDILKNNPEFKYIGLQGEGAGITDEGEAIQGNPHKFNSLRFFGFNLIDSKNGRWNSEKAAEYLKKYNIDWVPIIDTNYYLPENFEEFKISADGKCEADGASGLREGYVYRTVKTPVRSFKNVSRKYLLKEDSK